MSEPAGAGSSYEGTDLPRAAVGSRAAGEGEPGGSRPAERPGAPGDAPATECSGAPAGVDDAGVSRWMASAVPGLALPLSYSLIAGGRSNLTYAVTDAAGRRFVLRRPPTGQLLPTAHDMGREHRVVSALGPAGVPVPRTVGYCDDPAVNAAPFYVMDFVDGPILRTEGDAEAAFEPAGRRRVSESVVDTLAALHRVDPDAVGLGDLARRDGYIARQLKRWYGQYQRSRDEQGGPDVADVDTVHDRLAARIPPQDGTGIVHGDYRLDNTVLTPDGAVAAILDWELCTLGDVLADVGQLVVYWSEPGEVSALQHSATTADGFFSRSEVADRYATVSGRPVEQLDFYVAFAYWKLACILEGVYTRYLGGAMGRDGFDFSSYPAAIRQLGQQASDAAGRLA
jgi:aminoglycoside phosphotransferase (APT) family kinase protein